MKNFMELQQFITEDFCLTLNGIYNCNKKEIDFLKKNMNKKVHIYDIEINDYLYVQSENKDGLLNLGIITSIRRRDNEIVIETASHKTTVLSI